MVWALRQRHGGRHRLYKPWLMMVPPPVWDLTIVHLVHYSGSMPTIKRFSACRICIYPADHNPPHFHVITSDGSDVLVELADLHVHGVLAKRDLREALAWAAENIDLLNATFREYNP